MDRGTHEVKMKSLSTNLSYLMTLLGCDTKAIMPSAEDGFLSYRFAAPHVPYSFPNADVETTLFAMAKRIGQKCVLDMDEFFAFTGFNDEDMVDPDVIFEIGRIIDPIGFQSIESRYNSGLYKFINSEFVGSKKASDLASVGEFVDAAANTMTDSAVNSVATFMANKLLLDVGGISDEDLRREVMRSILDQISDSSLNPLNTMRAPKG